MLRIKCELVGVAQLWAYSYFEALKVQDEGLHRCNVTAIMKKSAMFRRNQTSTAPIREAVLVVLLVFVVCCVREGL